MKIILSLFVSLICLKGIGQNADSVLTGTWKLYESNQRHQVYRFFDGDKLGITIEPSKEVVIPCKSEYRGKLIIIQLFSHSGERKMISSIVAEHLDSETLKMQLFADDLDHYTFEETTENSAIYIIKKIKN